MNRSFRRSLLVSFILGALGATVGAADLLPLADGLYARFQTPKGEFVVQLDPGAAPMATTLFVGLAEGSLNPSAPGTPFYQKQTFHSVSPGIVVQGGDPTGTGTTFPGGPVPSDPGLVYNAPGVLGLFNARPDQNGSQFFVTLKPWPQLQGRYPAFGRVVQGLDVVRALVKDDTLTSVTIVRQGSVAQAFVADQASLAQKITAFQAAQALRDAQSEASSVANLAKVSEGTTTTSSGLRYKVLKAGTGRKPKAGQTITADYEGRLVDGTVFDSSYTRKVPFQFAVGTGHVIQAWDEALADMGVGEKRLLVVPPHLGYGAAGMPPTIPANAWLVFEVELVGIRG